MMFVKKFYNVETASVYIEMNVLCFKIRGDRSKRIKERDTNEFLHYTINGHTALMEALSDSEIFYLLLNAGADTMLRSKEGKTAYDMAVEQGRLDLVKTLMDYPH